MSARASARVQAEPTTRRDPIECDTLLGLFSCRGRRRRDDGGSPGRETSTKRALPAKRERLERRVDRRTFTSVGRPSPVPRQHFDAAARAAALGGRQGASPRSFSLALPHNHGRWAAPSTKRWPELRQFRRGRAGSAAIRRPSSPHANAAAEARRPLAAFERSYSACGHSYPGRPAWWPAVDRTEARQSDPARFTAW